VNFTVGGGTSFVGIVIVNTESVPIVAEFVAFLIAKIIVSAAS